MKNCDFRPISRFISEMMQNRAVVTIERQYRMVSFLMTLDDPYPRFQGHVIIWRWIFHKRYEIETLHWNTNRDLHIPYSMLSFQMILSELKWLSEIFNDTKHCAPQLLVFYPPSPPLHNNSWGITVAHMFALFFFHNHATNHDLYHVM